MRKRSKIYYQKLQEVWLKGCYFVFAIIIHEFQLQNCHSYKSTYLFLLSFTSCKIDQYTIEHSACQVCADPLN